MQKLKAYLLEVRCVCYAVSFAHGAEVHRIDLVSYAFNSRGCESSDTPEVQHIIHTVHLAARKNRHSSRPSSRDSRTSFPRCTHRGTHSTCGPLYSSCKSFS